jgi:precorrin-2/cobalt-factor-2 C20-methyltransferase
VTGKLFGLGVGPGDPELVTLKAQRILQFVKVVAYPVTDSGTSFARSIVAAYLPHGCTEMPIFVPMRVARSPAYAVYDSAAAAILAHLRASHDVAVLCEGDPFFYGSFMHLYTRLHGHCAIEVVAGVSSLTAGAAAIQRPLAARNDILTVIPAPLPDAKISKLLAVSDATAVIKVGRHFTRIRRLIENAGLMGVATYAERVGLPNQRLQPLASLDDHHVAPYFSMILTYDGAEDWPAGPGFATLADTAE